MFSRFMYVLNVPFLVKRTGRYIYGKVFTGNESEYVLILPEAISMHCSALSPVDLLAC